MKPGSQSCSCGLGVRTRPPIGQALAADAEKRFPGALTVVKAVRGAGVVAELELGKVAVQVLLTAMLVTSSIISPLEGIDTPELFSPKCPQEALQAAEARDRLRELLAPGFTLERHGVDRYKRTLGTLRVGGRDVGAVLVREGLARTWTGRREPWC